MRAKQKTHYNRAHYIGIFVNFDLNGLLLILFTAFIEIPVMIRKIITLYII